MPEIINISLCKSDNLEAYTQYNRGYAQITQERGPDYIIFMEDWYLRPNTYLCLFSNEKNEPIGGFRLQVHQPDYKLPIQNKSTKYDNKIASFIRNQKHFELCEGNGFFVIPEYRKSIISYEIARSFLIPVLLLDLKTMVGIALERTIKLFSLFDIVTSKKIMSPDEYFLYANNPKSFVFESHNLDEQVKERLKTAKDSHISKGMLENKQFSYTLNSGEKQYEFRFQNLIENQKELKNHSKLAELETFQKSTE